MNDLNEENKDRKSKAKHGVSYKYDEGIHTHIIKKLASEGYTQREICDVIGITVRVLERWFHTYPRCRLAWEQGRNIEEESVISNLKRLCETHISKTIIKNNKGEVIKIIENELPPSTHAISLFLRSKNPEKYMSRTYIQNTQNTENKDNYNDVVIQEEDKKL